MSDLIVMAIIEILGAPKEHVEETIKKVVEIAKKGYEVKDSKIHEAKQLDKLFGTFVELEFKIKKIDDLIAFCFDFMPSSIEIIEPTKFTIESTEVNNLFNELLARLHQYDMAIKNLNAQNKILQEKVKSRS